MMGRPRTFLSIFAAAAAVILSQFLLPVNPVFAAELYINVLAVNGTEEIKEKQIRQALPRELAAEDVLDTDSLKLEYDVNTGMYYVAGKVTLNPKETKTYKVRIRDLWQVDEADVGEIKKKIDSNLSSLKDTEYSQNGEKKKEALNKRLDFIINQQKSADNIEKRIDLYRTYDNEMKSIRDNALNIKYWRSSADEDAEEDIVYFVIKVENASADESLKSTPHHYLPVEVKPEHIVDLGGFDVQYDQDKKQSYLSKEEDLAPAEKKEYRIGIRNIWKIPENKIEDLKGRSRTAYKFLEDSKYKESADYLVKNIKQKLESVEASQKITRTIDEHISAFRANTQNYDIARKDVETLEDLLEIMREELERSRLKNVLQKIKALKSIADIAQNLFKKATENMVFKVILGIIAFVGLVTFVNFSIWGVRSKNAKLAEKEAPKEDAEKQSKT